MFARRAALPVLTPTRRRALIAFGLVVAVAMWAAIVAFAEPYDWSRLGTGHDARPYWTAAFDVPYATSRVGAHDAYLYSPAFLQLLAPLAEGPGGIRLRTAPAYSNTGPAGNPLPRARAPARRFTTRSSKRAKTRPLARCRGSRAPRTAPAGSKAASLTAKMCASRRS